MSTQTALQEASFAEAPGQRSGLLRHTALYGGASLAAYILSMLKAVVVSRLFGTTPEMDAYTVAILVPNLIGALISSTTAGALIPVLAKAERESEQARATVFRTSLAIFTVGSLAITLLLVLFAAPLAHLLGATFDPYRLSLTAKLLRWASVLAVSNGIYAVCSAELLARKRYGSVGMAPACGTAISLAILLSLSKPGIEVLVWSLVAGTAAQAVMLAIPAWRRSRGGVFSSWRNRHVKGNLTAQFHLLGAAMIGVANGFIDQMFAARLPSGSVSALSYAGTLHNILMQSVVMSLAWVALPDLSKLATCESSEPLRTRVRYCVALAAALAAPITAAVFAFGQDTVRLILQHGRFDANSTAAVFPTWAGYSLGLLPAAAGMIVVRLINALGKNDLLFRIGILLLLTNAALDYLFMHWFGLVGISLSTSFVYVVSAVTLFLVGRRFIGVILDRHTLALLSKVILSVLVSIAPVIVWRLRQTATPVIAMLQALLFFILLITTYVSCRFLRFEWRGLRGITGIPFHLALEIDP